MVFYLENCGCLEKLAPYGPGLTNHHQQVSINNIYSNSLPVVSGVPQGSILSPLLFIMYINNNITSFIHHSDLLKFTDDTNCFMHIITELDQIALQKDVNALVTWSSTTDMNFNLKKQYIYLSHVRLLLHITCLAQLSLIKIAIKTSAL